MAKRSRKKLTGRKGKLVPLSEAVTTQHVDSPSGNVKRAETLQQARRALLEANPIRAQELLLDHNPEDFDNLVDDISETAPSGEVAAMAEGLEEAGETKAVERVRKHLASREARFGVDTEAHVHARASRDLIRRDLALAEEARKLQPSIEVLGVTSGSPGLATIDYAGKQGDVIDSLQVKRKGGKRSGKVMAVKSKSGRETLRFAGKVSPAEWVEFDVIAVGSGSGKTGHPFSFDAVSPEVETSLDKQGVSQDDDTSAKDVPSGKDVEPPKSESKVEESAPASEERESESGRRVREGTPDPRPARNPSGFTVVESKPLESWPSRFKP